MTKPFQLPKRSAHAESWGDDELDLLSRLVYHPVCGLLYRHRYAMALSLVPECGRLLEVGCGHGLFLPSLSERAKTAHALDMHPYLDKAKRAMEESVTREITFTRGSIFGLPYKEESFDAVVCMSVLEHMTDIEKAVFELQRVVKKGGVLIVGFPIKNSMTRFLFRLIGRDDSTIHPQSHRSIIDALNSRMTIGVDKIFPSLLPRDLGFYYVGEYKKNG